MALMPTKPTVYGHARSQEGTVQPTTQSVEKLFQHERRYVVPLFQRAYVWNEEHHWAPLWEDIQRQALRSLDELVHDRKVSTHHFLGAVVLSNEQIYGLDLPRANIIDGQQRLTTLQVFLAAFRDYASRIHPVTAESISRITRNPGASLSGEQRCKVWPTNVDRAPFRAVMEAGSPEALRQTPSGTSGGQLAKAYLYFYSRIREYVEGDGIFDDERSSEEQLQRLSSILHALRTSLRFVVIELEEKDDPQVIFETLNARGAPLLPSDLIRNFLFLKASDGQDEGLAERLYATHWEQFDRPAENDGQDRFWHANERQGRLLRPRVDLFVFHYLTAQAEREIIITELFREFRRWFDEKKLGVEEVLADLHRASKDFARLINPVGQDRLDVFARRLKSLDTSTVYPVLMYLLGLPKQNLSEQQLAAIATDLESYLVRRVVCGLTSKNYNRLFLTLLQKLKRGVAEDADLSAVVREQLLQGKGPAVAWPSDAEFLRGWLEQPVYLKTKPERAVMILRALEEASRTGRNERIILPDDLTVEHLLPQRGALEHYPYGEAGDVWPQLSPDDRRGKLLHTLGNLSLLTHKLNASVSNGPFAKKSAAIGAESDLRLNARFRGDPIEVWSETSILDRGRELFARARAIWPVGHAEKDR
jgi:uncharacterized protein with ParB-like and HNH nuclease domain